MRFSNSLKNFSYSFFANAFSLLVSVLVVVVVPKVVPLREYGLWQLFLFYYGYVGFFHFGWNDGIYLRYAGFEYSSLDKKLFSGQLYSLVLFQLFVGMLLVMGSVFVEADSEKMYALLGATLIMPFVNFNSCVSFIMQITNRIADYAKIIIIEKAALVIVIIFVVGMNYRSFIDLYFAKVLSVCAVTCYAVYIIRDLLRRKVYPLKEILFETKKNISAGSKLLVANVSSLLMIGVVRYGISLGWDISTFGKVSLTLAISNFVLMFITACSVVLFPIIKRLDNAHLAVCYSKLRNCIVFLLLLALITYYPLKTIIAWWLPQYADSLIYMGILFPICMFESRVQLLTNTYLKSLRLEKVLLVVNVFSVFISLIFTYFSVGIFHDLTLAVCSIILLYALRSIISELILATRLELNLFKDILQEIIMTVIFISSAIFINDWKCIVVYAVAFILYALINRNKLEDIKSMANSLIY